MIALDRGNGTYTKHFAGTHLLPLLLIGLALVLTISLRLLTCDVPQPLP